MVGDQVSHLLIPFCGIRLFVTKIVDSTAPNAALSPLPRPGFGRLRRHRRQAVEALYRYVAVNRERVRYDVFRAKGYLIGSEIVEEVCKRVVGDRLTRSGMIGSRSGLSATRALRICWLNQQWHPLWQQKPLAP